MATADCVIVFSDGTDSVVFTDANFKKLMLGRDNGPNSPGCAEHTHTFQIIAVGQPGGAKVKMGTLAVSETALTALGLSSGDAIRPSGSTTPLPPAKGLELGTNTDTCDGNAVNDLSNV